MTPESSQAVGLERAVLAGAFLRPELVRLAGDILPEDFASEAHAELWRTIRSLAQEDGSPVDYLTVEVDLVRRKKIHLLPGDWRRGKDAEGALAERGEARAPLHGWMPHPYLLALDESLPCLSRWPRYVQGVVEAWGRRQIHRLATDISGSLDGELAEEIARIEKRIGDVKRALPAGGSATAMEVLANSDGSVVAGLSTGLMDWDRVTMGLEPGDTAIVAGRPGHGKSALALTVARNVAKRGGRVFYASLEMTPRQLIEHRLVAMESGVPMRSIRSWQLSREQEEKVIAARERIAWWPLHATEKCHTVAQIQRESERIIGKQGPLDLVVVDYLGLMPVPGARNDQERVSSSSRGLRLMALEMGIPVLALHQMNREVEHRGQNPVPRLSDLRDSGSVEQDASMVTFVVRPELFHAEGSSERQRLAGTAELHVAKQRQGEAGRVVPVSFRGELTLFCDLYRGSSFG